MSVSEEVDTGCGQHHLCSQHYYATNSHCQSVSECALCGSKSHHRAGSDRSRPLPQPERIQVDMTGIQKSV